MNLLMRSTTIAAICLAAGLGCKTTKKASDKPQTGTTPAGPQGAAPRGSTARGTAMSASDEFASLAKRIDGERAQGGANDAFWTNVSQRLSRFTKKHSNYGLAWYNLGVAQEKLKKYDAAEQSYTRATHADPSLSEAAENLAALLLSRGSHREAKRVLEGAVADNPAASGARVALARSLLNTGDRSAAVRLAREALAKDPKSIGAYCVLSMAAVERRDYLRARLLVSQGLKVDKGPASACLNHSLGLALLKQKKTAKALDQFSQVIQKDGGKILDARFKVAEISMGFKDFHRAIQTYKNVIDIQPRNTAAYVNLGVAYKGSGQFAEAEKAYLKAIEVAGEKPHSSAHFNLGVLYLKNLDRISDAKTQLKRYLEVHENPRTSDPAYGWLDEIKQREKMEVEMKRMEAEAERQAELEAKAEKERQEEEARKKAEEAAEKKRLQEIEDKAKERSANEPGT